MFHITGSVRHMVARSELESALEHYQATVRQASASGDWTLFAGLFTETADYNEHAYGRFQGRARIADWAVRTMTNFPGNCGSLYAGLINQEIKDAMGAVIAKTSSVTDAFTTANDNIQACLDKG